MKITLTSEDSVRLEPAPGPLTIEAPTADTRYSPFHMLGSSLAVCTHSILASWAANAGIDADDLVLDVAWRFAEQPHRVGEVSLAIDWPELPAARRAAAQRIAALCPIHATLAHSPSVAITVRSAEPSETAGAPVAAGASLAQPAAPSPATAVQSAS